MASEAVWIFPGQGSQAPGMGADLYEAYSEYREVFEVAAAVLGYDIAGLCLEGPAEKLSATVHTQPAVFTVSAAMLAMLEGRVEEPMYAAGHSLGEYAACLAAGVFDFTTGIRIVAERARIMEKAAAEKPGRMLAALGLDAAGADVVVGDFRDGEAAVANYNCPEQVVVSVGADAAAKMAEALSAAGAKRIVELDVGGAFHSPAMAGAAAELAKYLEEIEFREARFPVILNETARPATDGEVVKSSLAKQLTGPVKWEQSISFMADAGAKLFIEVGPGRVLTNLNSRIVPSAIVLSTANLAGAEEAIEMA